jgi:very-short-patch-repair endonuclease
MGRARSSDSFVGGETMILEEETFRKFGYYPSDWAPKSSKKVLATCDTCGKIRITSKNAYRASCGSCATKGDKNSFFGRHHSEEARRKNREAKCGKNNPNYGKHLSEETRRKMSEARKYQTFPTHHTKPEMIWQEIVMEKHNLPFKYTGDGSFWVGGSPAINPDFIHLTKKIAVEIFSYWHDPLRRNGKVRYAGTYEGRKKILKKYGWKMIVFWQDDLEREDAEVFVLSELRKEGVIK